MKLCTNCKHHAEIVGHVHTCLRAVVKKDSLIDGRPMDEGLKYCRSERYDSEEWKCGPDGKFFEEKV